MREPAQQSATRLLHELRAGNREALAELFPLVYRELHQIAGRHRRHWEGDDTLNTTALVHETYLKLIAVERVRWEDRAHFMALAATAMVAMLTARRPKATNDRFRGMRVLRFRIGVRATFYSALLYGGSWWTRPALNCRISAASIAST